MKLLGHIRNIQSGNALFLILIAVALFAALSYAVTNSGRGGAGIDKEQAEIEAAQAIQYAAQIRSTIQRLQLINGCSDTEISFETTAWDDTIEAEYVNPSTREDCKVFSPDGGAAHWVDGVAYSGNDIITGVGTDCSDSSCAELVSRIKVEADELEIAETINRNMGHSELNPLITDSIILINPRFDGTYGNRETALSDPALDSLTDVCYKHNAGHALCYFVLIAR